MTPSIKQLKRYAALAGAMVLAAGSPVLRSGEVATLQIDGFVLRGNVVEIAVTNPGHKALSGTVLLRAWLQDGSEAAASQPVVVFGGQKVFVEMVLSSPVIDVIELGGVLDDGSPF